MNSATQRVTSLAVAAFAVAVMVMSSVADAARIGGGRSLGAQRPSVAPKMTAPQTPPAATQAAPGAASNPVMPATPGATIPGRAAAPAAAASGASRWLGPIAGIAAGLGLAALLSHFGLPEGLASILLIGLLVFAGIFLVRYLFARRSTPQRPYAYAGAPAGASPSSFEMPKAPAPAYNESARVEPVLGSSPAASATGISLPAGFDADSFVRNAKQQFVRLQAAHDRGDRKVLSEVLTPEMYAEVTLELEGRAPTPPSEVLTLGADVLEVATESNRYWASVRFTGTMRESGSTSPVAFDEVWNLTKPTDGSSGWLLAGIQQPA